MRDTLLKLIPLLALVLAAWSVPSCVREPSPLVRVGTNVWPGYEGLYLARGLGYYEGASIKLVEYPSTSEVLRAWRNGLIEAAGLTMDEALHLVELGHEPAVVLVMDISHGADTIVAHPEIEGVEDLGGRRVGVESTALGAFVITRALEKAGMTTDDITMVSLDLSEHEGAFIKGEVDAVVTFEPYRTKLIRRGAREIFDSAMIPGEIVDVLVVRRSLVESHAETLERLVDGWFRAVRHLEENPSEASVAAAPRAGVTPEQFLESLEGLRIPSREENRKLLAGDEEFVEGLRRLSRIMVENGVQREYIDPAPLLVDRFVKGRRP